MALGKTIIARDGGKSSRRRHVKLTADNAYAAGGYAVAKADFELDTSIDVLIFSGPTVNGFIPAWDAANSKIKFFKVGAAGALTECANAEATLANQDVYAEVIGDIVSGR